MKNTTLSTEKKEWINYLWWIPAGIPLLLILTSFFLGGWYWGLMDDTHMVLLPGNIWERIISWSTFLLNDGRLIPVASFHCAFFYKIFAGNPTGFYIFRWCEVLLALCMWGAVVSHVTGKKWAAALFFTVTLGFYNFYNAFFLLSVQEPLGVLFSAPAIFFFLKAVQPVLDHGRDFNRRSLVLSFMFLLLAVGAKETFFVVVAALGISTVLFSFQKGNFKKLLGLGIFILVLSILYIVSIKIWIVRGYSLGYNFHKSLDNAGVWFKNDLLWHTPWIFIAIVLMIMRGRPAIASRSHYFAVVLSIMLYLGYTFILLPWNSWGYYAIPLGVFFAFMATVLIANYFDRIPRWLTVGIIGASLLFNICTAGAVLRWQYSYQQDTKNLLIWMGQNAIFKHEVMDTGALVRGNAEEACYTIPEMSKMRYGNGYAPFIFTANVHEILKDTKTKYYLWGPYWGDQDLRLLGDMWSPMFVSDHWIMFRRMY